MDTALREELAATLTEPGESLAVRLDAAVALAEAGDARAFETLVMVLNYRDPGLADIAARALARLADPRTARAAAALATNPLRTSYALPAIRLLVSLRAAEAVPALTQTLELLLAEPGSPYRRIALECVEGLGELADRRAVPVLRSASEDARLREAARIALARLEQRGGQEAVE
ncbi:adenylosuccinate lyase [Streptomyces sp. NBC_01537]|uniref:adenylosuccinate lyase n=1 Tax=Streptomyces sp. NBC_01537 TaxID=2903896 RepID=UPI003870D463